MLALGKLRDGMLLARQGGRKASYHVQTVFSRKREFVGAKSDSGPVGVAFRSVTHLGRKPQFGSQGVTDAARGAAMRKDVAVVYGNLDDVFSLPHFKSEIKARGANVRFVKASRLRVDAHTGQVLLKRRGPGKDKPFTPEAVISRGMYGGADILRRLQAQGSHVVNTGDAVVNSGPKNDMARVFAEHGLPHPRTTIANSRAALNAAAKTHGLPMVVKVPVGSGGVGVHKADTMKEVDALGRKYIDSGMFPVLVAQDFISHAAGKDLRLDYVRNASGEVEFVAAIHREAPRSGEFRANSPELKNIATYLPADHPSVAAAIPIGKKAVEAFDADVMGVDFLYADNGAMLIGEVNSTPAIAELDARISDRRSHMLPLIADYAVYGPSRHNAG